MPDKAFVENLLKTGGLSWFWWVAYYLYQVHKWERFRMVWFIINIVLAFFIWYLVWEFMPASLEGYSNGIISVSGFLAFPILDILESKVPLLFENYITKWNIWKK